MARLLFLSQRIPYPPNKGDKIRAYHFLRHFAAAHSVRVGAFVDDPLDREHRAAVAAMCEAVNLPDLDPRMARLGSLVGFATGAPLSVAYFARSDMRRWVHDQLRSWKPDIVFVFSSNMAGHVLTGRPPGARFVMDFCDVDSDKFRSYAEASSWPMSAIYRREAARLLAFERRVAADCDLALFATDAEARLFQRLAPEVRDRTHAVQNGVDSEYFSPSGPWERPYPADRCAFVFTGAMDYRPNIDAVAWFADAVFPGLLKALPNAMFCIVGSNPAPDVRALADRPGIVVTGRVPDVRPYVAHAAACVAPLRIARGVQNKVLEAMSMAKPVVATREALEGLDVRSGVDVIEANTPDDQMRACLGVVAGDMGGSIGNSARAMVLARHAWSASMARLDTLIAQ